MLEGFDNFKVRPALLHLSNCCLEHGVVAVGAAYSVVIVTGITVVTVVVRLSPKKSRVMIGTSENACV